MKVCKISKLLNDTTVSKFVTKRWFKVNYLSTGKYSANKNIGFKTPMLRKDLCDYSDAHIFAKGRITGKGTNGNNRENKRTNF